MKYPSITISAFLLWSYSSTVDSFSFSSNRISQLPTFSRRSIALFEQSVNGDAPAPFTVETAQTGPSDSDVHTLTVNLGQGEDEDPIVMQTGKIGRQAAGAVTLTRGDTVLFTTAARDDNPKEEIDFLPLSVEHQERFSAVGTTSGSYNKRDGRPSEHEILTCRLIDRPLRPLVADGWRHETQLLSWVMSYDGLRSTDPLAITAAATALYISDVPISKPVAGVQVGYVDDEFVLNPTHEQMATSKLNLILAGTKEAVLMIEGEADFLPEATMIEGVTFGHNAIKTLCEGIEEFGQAIGVKKNYSTIPEPIEGLQERVDEVMTERVDAMWDLHGVKSAQSEVQSTISKAVVEELSEEFPEQTLAIKKAFKDLLCRRMFEKAKNTGLRCDGRKLDQVRRLDMETSILPRVHGSALFTRGETQSIATATLGDAGMKQKIDKLDGLHQKRFYLQYTFPPSCVGETGRTGMPGRREVGHGNLAERALAPSLPTEEDFPYTIRVESLITESHGSSSMASVCGGSLALMDAGVPVKAPVAGIAMGMLLGDKGGISDENAVIVSDILGTEDALGTMDFKVAGNREGISTFQLDIKCEGLTLETMEKALEQARQGRLHILDGMSEVLGAPREELPDTVPKMHAMSIPDEKIGTVIGPGGKQIRAIIEDFELTNMNVAEDGGIQMTAMNPEKLKAAEEFINNLIKSAPAGRGGKPRGGGGGRPKYAGPDAEVGKIYTGKITGIHNFGVFMEILPGAEDGSTPGLEGLCHVSELHTERVRNCEGYVNSLNTEELEVKFLGKNDRGQLKLSRKEAMEEKMGTKKPAPPQQSMSEEEIDVIAQAIEGVAEM